MNALDEYLDQCLGPIVNTPGVCCSSQNIVIREEWNVCTNCARIFDKDETIIKEQFLNPKYQLTTSIGFGPNSRVIRRLHQWTNHDYRENMANNNYIEIRELGKQLNSKVLDNACFIYKGIYIDNNVSSRNKIKRALYVYCLNKSCDDYNVYFDIIKTLNDNKLSINNYNKALLKVNDEDKLFLNRQIVNKYKIMSDNWNVKITIKDIIIEYNRLFKIIKQNKYRLNNNSILIGTIYFLLKAVVESSKMDKFYKTFDISITTIEKFKNLYVDKELI